MALSPYLCASAGLVYLLRSKSKFSATHSRGRFKLTLFGGGMDSGMLLQIADSARACSAKRDRLPPPQTSNSDTNATTKDTPTAEFSHLLALMGVVRVEAVGHVGAAAANPLQHHPSRPRPPAAPSHWDATQQCNNAAKTDRVGLSLRRVHPYPRKTQRLDQRCEPKRRQRQQR